MRLYDSIELSTASALLISYTSRLWYMRAHAEGIKASRRRRAQQKQRMVEAGAEMHVLLERTKTDGTFERPNR